MPLKWVAKRDLCLIEDNINVPSVNKNKIYKIKQISKQACILQVVLMWCQHLEHQSIYISRQKCDRRA